MVGGVAGGVADVVVDVDVVGMSSGAMSRIPPSSNDSNERHFRWV